MADRFETILIANRGEIARRVIRTARELGYRTVAVYSEADRSALHAQDADEAIEIGPGPAAQSYLDAGKIIRAAREAGAGAIHPGYGFLSENAAFARAVREAGLVFIGPSPEAIDLMGDKARAKRAMIEAGVPCIPGYEEEDQSDERFIAAAKEAGYPVMVKAAAGGGGRGMRLVSDATSLPAALADARKEAEAAFGSGDLILEKAILRGRHIEVQVFGDSLGNIIHLGERDCSLQRRHQKVIEEAPSPAVDPALRRKMGEAAVKAAAAVDYCGAGTVEFLLNEDGSFYFLEMNTRLQVEHPVTEEVTGLDLVALQITVAQGEPLGLNQDDVTLEDHAIEARLYAEDPSQDFLPQTGVIAGWVPPRDLRIDSAVGEGDAVSPFYDPMIAKLIARGENREDARRKLIRGLEQLGVHGIVTNRSFLIDLLKTDVFAQGGATTRFIDERVDFEKPSPTNETLGLAAIIEHVEAANHWYQKTGIPAELRGWQPGLELQRPFRFRGDDRMLFLSGQDYGQFSMQLGEEVTHFEVLQLENGHGRVRIGSKTESFTYHLAADGLHLSLSAADHLLVNDLAPGAAGSDEEADGIITAEMHGLVTAVHIEPGQMVEAGQRVLLLEAMKMQHDIKSPVSGKVIEVTAAEGQQVASGDRLVIIDQQEEQTS